MKVLCTTLLLAALIGSGPAVAKVEQCRFITSKPDREACYDRQAKALEAKKAEAAAKQKPVVPLERRNAEDAELARQLKSICRGC